MKICSRLVTADLGGQKNRNGKSIVVLFLPWFSTSVGTIDNDHQIKGLLVTLVGFHRVEIQGHAPNSRVMVPTTSIHTKMNVRNSNSAKTRKNDLRNHQDFLLWKLLPINVAWYGIIDVHNMLVALWQYACGILWGQHAHIKWKEIGEGRWCDLASMF